MSPTAIVVANSNVVKSMDYDTFTGVLTVDLNGTAYQYAMVPAHVYNSFKNSRTKGKFFAQNIRDKFATRKMVKQTVLVPA